MVLRHRLDGKNVLIKTKNYPMSVKKTKKNKRVVLDVLNISFGF